MAIKIENQKSVLFSIVVYKENFWETETFKNLVSSYQKSNDSSALHIFVYDNTPGDISQIDHFKHSAEEIKVEYFHNPENPGISKAYNDIGNYAQKQEFQALVFLDQDTRLPENTYDSYTNYCEKNKGFCVAIPKIKINGNILSPAKYVNYRSAQLDEIKEGKISTKNISWINSGMMVETVFFLKSGGYNPKIQLDFSDHFFVEKLKNMGLDEVNILPLVLEQNLSVYTNSKAQDIARYALFLRDLKGYRGDKNKMIIFFNVDLPRLISLSWKHKSIKFIYIRIKKIKFIKI